MGRGRYVADVRGLSDELQLKKNCTEGSRGWNRVKERLKKRRGRECVVAGKFF